MTSPNAARNIGKSQEMLDGNCGNLPSNGTRLKSYIRATTSKDGRSDSYAGALEVGTIAASFDEAESHLRAPG
jgi:hypothetical protein